MIMSHLVCPLIVFGLFFSRNVVGATPSRYVRDVSLFLPSISFRLSSLSLCLSVLDFLVYPMPARSSLHAAVPYRPAYSMLLSLSCDSTRLLPEMRYRTLLFTHHVRSSCPVLHCISLFYKFFVPILSFGLCHLVFSMMYKDSSRSVLLSLLAHV